jgi:hypothetical protein
MEEKTFKEIMENPTKESIINFLLLKPHFYHAFRREDCIGEDLYVFDWLSNDRDLTLKFVSLYKPNFRYINPIFKSDKEIFMIAISDGYENNIEHIGEDLLNDPEVYQIALEYYISNEEMYTNGIFSGCGFDEDEIKYGDMVKKMVNQANF